MNGNPKKLSVMETSVSIVSITAVGEKRGVMIKSVPPNKRLTGRFFARTSIE